MVQLGLTIRCGESENSLASPFSQKILWAHNGNKPGAKQARRKKARWSSNWSAKSWSRPNSAGLTPTSIARLFVAVEKAKKASVYQGHHRARHQKGRGHRRGKGQLTRPSFMKGYAPHKVPVVVECLTDNRNRTAPEIRNLFKAGSHRPARQRRIFLQSPRRGRGHASGREPRCRGRCHRSRRARKSSRSKPMKFPKARRARVFSRDQGTGPRFQGVEGGGLERHRLGNALRRQEIPRKSRTPHAHKEVVDFLNALDDHDDVHHVYAAMK